MRSEGWDGEEEVQWDFSMRPTVDIGSVSHGEIFE